MHPLKNGSQAETRPPKKPTQGNAGWFTESGENNAPSYPGQDWFNSNIAEFLNALSGAGITFDPNREDHLLRCFQQFSGGYFPFDADNVNDVDGIDFDTSVDNRNIIYSNAKKIYVPVGVTIRCNFLPDDDVRQLFGEGKILTQDPWGNEHVFDLERSGKGTKFVPSQLIAQSIKTGTHQVLGFLGDSITDGANSTGWITNPWDGQNLNSTNYDHDVLGAPNGYVAKLKGELNRYVLTGDLAFSTANASKSGQKLFDGWAYRNFDYGFFQNAAYGNAAPSILYVSMGVNDNSSLLDGGDFIEYLDEFDKLIRKAWGYGSSVGFITVSNMTLALSSLELGLKLSIERLYHGVESFDITKELYEQVQSLRSPNLSQLFGPSPYDMTHPNDDGHSIMAATLMRRLLPSLFMDLRINAPVRSSNCLIRTFPDKTVVAPGLVDAPSYLSRFSAFMAAKITDSFNAYYMLYIPDASSALTFVFPRISTGTSVNISIRQFTRVGNSDYINHSVTPIDSHETIVAITGVRPGFCQINIAVSDQPESFILPFIMVSDGSTTDFLRTTPLTIPDSSIRPAIHTGDLLLAQNTHLIPLTRKLPAFSNQGNFSITYTIRGFSDSGSVSYAFAYHPEIEDGLLFEIDGGVASVYDIASNSKGSLLHTFPGSYDSGTLLTVTTNTTGITLTARSSDGATFSSHSINGKRSGTIYHANFTGTPITQYLEVSSSIL